MTKETVLIKNGVYDDNELRKLLNQELHCFHLDFHVGAHARLLEIRNGTFLELRLSFYESLLHHQAFSNPFY